MKTTKIRKTNNCSWTDRLVTWLACASVLLCIHARAQSVIDPDGTLYTGASAQVWWNDTPDFGPQHLFDVNMTGMAVGANLTGLHANDFVAGNGDGSSVQTYYVAFQLDQDYANINSVFYAQRSGNNPLADKIQTLTIWSSATTPFTAANPGTLGESINITDQNPAEWAEYTLSTPISGQYFLIEGAQTTQNGNPGGFQLRLGASSVPEPGTLNVIVAGLMGTAFLCKRNWKQKLV